MRGSLENRQPSLAFLLGPGLNYAAAALKHLLPGTYTVSIQPCTLFDGRIVDKSDSYWSPASALDLGATIDAVLDSGRAAGGIAVLEWQPVLKAFPQSTGSIAKLLRDRLEAHAADAATSGYWGRHWIRNCRDFVSGSNPLASLTEHGTRTILLACAGPSLSNAIPTIYAMRNTFVVWALSSACPALTAAGIVPDLVVSSDPGFWSSAHLNHIQRSGLPVAAFPSARLGSAILDGRTPQVVLCSDLAFEADAIQASGIGQVQAAETSGTVAGTAIALARAKTSGDIILAGLDLAASADREHAAPHAFDMLDMLAGQRLRPAYSLRCGRILDNYPERLGNSGWRRSRTLSLYAQELRRHIKPHGLYRIGCSPVALGIPCIDVTTTLHQPGGASAKPELQYHERTGSMASRSKAFAELLEERARQLAKRLAACIDQGMALDRSSAMQILAMAGPPAAAIIADTARGKGRPSMPDEVQAGMLASLRGLMVHQTDGGGYDCRTASAIRPRVDQGTVPGAMTGSVR